MSERKIQDDKYSEDSELSEIDTDDNLSIVEQQTYSNERIPTEIMPLDPEGLKSQLGQYKVKIKAVCETDQQLEYDFRKDSGPESRNDASKRICEILGENQEAINELYSGCPENPVTTARKKYIDYLAKRQEEIKNLNTSDPKKINMKDLLGKEGVELYKAAVEEEMKSREYRQAVFLQSCTVYEGEPNKRDVMYIGGPSGGGKSTAVTNILKELRTDGTEQKIMLAIDGGVHRELSAMRQLTNAFADMHNFNEISDLHKTTNVKVDNTFKRVAERAKLNTVHPVTFADTFLNPWKQWKVKNKADKLLKDKKNNVHFVEVEIDENACKKMGSSRSASSLQNNERAALYSSKSNSSLSPDKVKNINNLVELRTPGESKAASKAVPLGIKMTKWAREMFNKLSKKNDNLKVYSYKSGLRVNIDPDGGEHLGNPKEFEFLQKIKKLAKEPNLNFSPPTVNKSEIKKIVTDYFETNNLKNVEAKSDEIIEKCNNLIKTKHEKGEPITFSDITDTFVSKKGKRTLPFIDGEVEVFQLGKKIPSLKNIDEGIANGSIDLDVDGLVSHDNSDNNSEPESKPSQRYDGMNNYNPPAPHRLDEAKNSEPSNLAALPKFVVNKFEEVEENKNPKRRNSITSR